MPVRVIICDTPNSLELHNNSIQQKPLHYSSLSVIAFCYLVLVYKGDNKYLTLPATATVASCVMRIIRDRVG
jgi:hypothetical protein